MSSWRPRFRGCHPDNERTHIALDVFYERTHLLTNETGNTRPKKGEDEAGDFKGGIRAVRREGLLCHNHKSHFQKGAYRGRDVVQLFRNERGSGAVFLRGGAVRSHGMAPRKSAAEKSGYCRKPFRD